MNRTPQLDHPLLPSDAEFERMKRTVLTRIDADGASVHQLPPGRGAGRRRSGKRIAATAGIAATVMTLALVATNVLGPRGAATAEAAEVLNQAAAAAAEVTDPAVGPDQFLLVETDWKSLGVHSSAAVLEEQKRMLYVPGDADASWYLRVEIERPDQVLGNPEDEGLVRYLENFPFDKLRHYQGAYGKFGGKYVLPTAEDFADMPRNPDGLLDYVYAMPSGSDWGPDERAFRVISDALIMGLVPADLRAAMYEALAKIPGVFLTDGVANLGGRQGVAISYRNEAGYSVEQLILDPTTGEFIGVREVTIKADRFIPAGTVVNSSAVTRSVVDEVPDGEYVVPPEAG
jgi:hypothetical protein